MFLPLSKEGVTAFLEPEDGLRLPATTAGLINLVWKNEYWTQRIFDLKVYKTSKTKIEAIFLQLLAVRFIAAKCKDDGVYWVIEREESRRPYPPYRYLNGDNWIGVHLISAGQKRSVPLTLLPPSN